MATDAGTIYSEVRIQLDRLRGDISRMETQFKKFSRTNQTKAKTVEKSWTSRFKNINLAGVAAFAGLSLAVKRSISVFADFEQSLANVQSVARGTPEEFRRLQDAAQRAGETTRFTASQAADAMYSLASAGLDTTQTIEALDGVLQLAGATQSDLASTSATVVSALSQYGLEAEESARVSNVFAAAIANSQANMDKLSTAMRQVGPVAGTLGISIEETTGALQALFDAGFRGEQAGTALRNILAALSDQADPTTRKLLDLGLTFDELDPAINNVTEIIGNLEDAALETGDVLGAFGREAGPQILSLLRVGRDGLEDYTGAITDTNAAAEAYAIQNDTLAGSLDELESAVESAVIELVQQLAPTLRTIIDIVTDLVRMLNKIPGPFKMFLAIVAGGIPIIAGATAAVTALAGAVGTLLGPISLAVAAVGGLVAAISAIKKHRETKLEEEFGAVAESAELSTREVEALTHALQLGVASGADLVDQISKLSENLDIAEDKVIAVALASVDITDEQREILRQILRQKEEQEEQLATLRAAEDEYRDMLGLMEDAHRFDELRAELAESQAEARREELAVFARGLNVSVEHVQAIARAMEDAGRTGEDFEMSVSSIADELELAETKVIGVALASADVSEEQKDQLKRYVAANFELEEQQEILEDLSDAEALRTELTVIRSQLAQKERDLSEIERLRAKDYSEEQIQNILDRNDALAEYESTIRSVNARREAGIESTEEGLRREIEAGERFLDILVDLGWTAERGGRVGEAIYRRVAASIASAEEQLAALRQEASRPEVEEQIEKWNFRMLKLLGTEKEVLEAERERAIAAARATEATVDDIDELVAAINTYYDALLDTDEATDDVGEATERYKDKLRDLVASERDVIEAERDRALAAIDASQASADEVDELKAAINDYYDALLEGVDGPLEEWLDAHEQAISAVIGAFNNLTSSLSRLAQSRADSQIAEIERTTNAELSDLDRRLQERLRYEGLAEDSHIESLRRRLARAIENGEEETAEKLRQEIRRTEIEQEFAEERTEIEEEAAQDSAELEYKAALAAWRIQVATAIANAAQAILTIWAKWAANPIVAGVLTAAAGVATGIQLAAINEAKPEKPEFAGGGLVVPDFAHGGIVRPQQSISQHASYITQNRPTPGFHTGGIVVPSGTTGRTVNVAENGAPELMLNAGGEGAALLDTFADRIVSAMGRRDSRGGSMVMQLVIDGRRIAESTVDYINNGQVRVKL